MTYTTQQQMIDRYGEADMIRATDRKNLGVIDSDVLALAMATAAGTIDGYLLRRYTLPLVSVPQVLVSAAQSLTWYFLQPHGAAEEARNGYKDALKVLDNLASGNFVIDAPAAAQASASGAPEFTSAERAFSRDSLKDF